jgi:hypothetical protein
MEWHLVAASVQCFHRLKKLVYCGVAFGTAFDLTQVNAVSGGWSHSHVSGTHLDVKAGGV